MNTIIYRNFLVISIAFLNLFLLSEAFSKKVYSFEVEARITHTNEKNSIFSKNRLVFLTFDVNKELHELENIVGRRRIKSPVSNIQLDYDNGKYIGTAKFADIAITDHGENSDRSFKIYNLQGIKFPKIDGAKYEPSTILEIEAKLSSDLFKGAKFRNIEEYLNVNDTFSSISAAWKKPNSTSTEPQEWFVSKVYSVSISRENINN